MGAQPPPRPHPAADVGAHVVADVTRAEELPVEPHHAAVPAGLAVVHDKGPGDPPGADEHGTTLVEPTFAFVRAH